MRSKQHLLSPREYTSNLKYIEFIYIFFHDILTGVDIAPLSYSAKFEAPVYGFRDTFSKLPYS
jgi:hypothetical protein